MTSSSVKPNLFCSVKKGVISEGLRGGSGSSEPSDGAVEDRRDGWGSGRGTNWDGEVGSSEMELRECRNS